MSLPIGIRNIQEFDNLNSLLKALENEAGTGSYLYRGQIERYDPVSTAGLLFENIFPRDVRALTKRWARTAEELTSAREIHRKNRDRFRSFLLEKAYGDSLQLLWLKNSSDAGIERMAIYERISGSAEPKIGRDHPVEVRIAEHWLLSELNLGANDPVFSATWALAQHYEIPTGIVDFTKSPRIAAWFATNRWDENDRSPFPAHGVIYRLDRERFESRFSEWYLQSVYESMIEGREIPHRFTIEDISNIPTGCALRPSRQEGCSVLGLDQLRMLAEAEPQNALIDAFLFKHGNQGYDLGHLSRDYLVPRQPEDPFLALKAEFERN